MVADQALNDVIHRPGGQFGGNVGGAFELEWPRARKLDGTADPVGMFGRLGQRLESIAPVEQHAETSIALRHDVDGAQPQHLELRDPLPVGAEICGEILELAAMIDRKNGQVF